MFSSAECRICFDETEMAVGLPCYCRLCSSCVWLHIKQKIIENFELISCPGACGAQFKYDELFPIAQVNGFSRDLEELILMKYSAHTNDIRKCPSPGCNFFGIIPKTQCPFKLECDTCDVHWDCPDLQPLNDVFRTLICDKERLQNEFLNMMYEYLLTKHCPKCEVAIYKNGGCYHMTCANCKFQFCWFCLKEYQSHSIEQCMIHMLITYGFLVYFFTNFAIIFGYHVPVYNAFMLIMSTFINCLANNAILLMIFRFFRGAAQIEISKDPKDDTSYKMITDFVIEISKILITCGIAHVFDISFWSWVWYITYQMIGLLSAWCVYMQAKKVVKAFSKRWLNFVK